MNCFVFMLLIAKNFALQGHARSLDVLSVLQHERKLMHQMTHLINDVLPAMQKKLLLPWGEQSEPMSPEPKSPVDPCPR